MPRCCWIFGLAKARGRRQDPQRCCRCFASPCGPSAGCLPSLGCPARATQAKPKTRNPMGESKKGHLAALPARLKPAGGDAPSRAPCHTAFLTLARRFLIFSQVLRSAIVSQAFRDYSKVLPSDMLLHWRTLLDGPAMLSYRSPLGRPSSPAGKASRKSLAHPSRGCTNHAKIVMEIPGLDPSLK